MTNYTLGRGKIFFGQFAAGSQNPGGERYLGNTPEFNLTIEEETLDHFSSDEGVREKDDSISLEVTRSGTLITDNIDPKNVALFFFGNADALSVVGSTIDDEEINGVEQGLYYQLGVSASNPSGHRGLTPYTPADPGPLANIIVEDNPATTTYVEGTDYTIDMERARIQIIEGGAISDGDNILVSYKTDDTTRDRIISGNAAIEGAMRYIAHNAKGPDLDYFLPWVRISPNGDYALKGDEWQQIPFSIEVLKKTGLEAIYVDGQPVASA